MILKPRSMVGYCRFDRSTKGIVLTLNQSYNQPVPVASAREGGEGIVVGGIVRDCFAFQQWKNWSTALGVRTPHIPSSTSHKVFKICVFLLIREDPQKSLSLIKCLIRLWTLSRFRSYSHYSAKSLNLFLIISTTFH